MNKTERDRKEVPSREFLTVATERLVLGIYRAYYCAASLLFCVTMWLIVFLFGAVMIVIDQHEADFWPATSPVLAVVLFQAGFILSSLRAHRISSMRRAWMPFALQIPALVWMIYGIMKWPGGDWPSRLCFAIYPFVLGCILICGLTLAIFHAVLTPSR